MSNPLVIEILSPFNMYEPIHRMKISEIRKKLADKYIFSDFGSSNTLPDGIVINCLHQDLIEDPDFIAIISPRFAKAVVMLVMGDFYPNSIDYLNKWSKYVDVFLVPTPEMRDFVKIFTNKRVEILLDPIDFGLDHSQGLRSKRERGTRVVWFGYPESYSKSMVLFEPVLAKMHHAGDIEYHIVSKNDSYGEGPYGFMHEYNPDTFLELLSMFDVCVLSHFPFDFSISTQWKSENKAVLAINQGLPVLASNTAAYSRLLKDNGVGEYCFSSPEELEVALKKIISPTNRVGYLANCQDRILFQYAAKKMALDWESIFLSEKLIKSK